MSHYDRDGSVERQQIHEIALNIARRLLNALETGRHAPPQLAGEIDATARRISDVQRDVETVMATQPFGAPLDMPVLTHILASQQHALGLLEQLETRIQGYAAPTPAPWPVETTAPAPRYPAQQHWGAAGPPAHAPAPRHPGYAPSAPPYARPAPGQGQPSGRAAPVRPPAPHPSQYGASTAPQQQRPAQPQTPAQQQQQQQRRGGKPSTALLSRRLNFAALGRRLTEPIYAAAAATLTVMAGTLLVASFLMPGPASVQARRDEASGPKLDGRLGAGEPTPSASSPAAPDPTAQFAAAAADPSSVEQPYLVVLTTRLTTEELRKDFEGFSETYAALLEGRKARVERIQGQDQKTWHRLSLVPPQSQADAKALCAKLRAAGLTGCWIRRVPLGDASLR